jgi:hypothetical protein
MFVVTEEDEAAIRAVYEQRGEFAAAIELRQRFPGITDNAQARACVRIIAGWKPLPLRAVKRVPKVPPLRRLRCRGPAAAIEPGAIMVMQFGVGGCRARKRRAAARGSAPS